jgi:hypothetical protein
MKRSSVVVTQTITKNNNQLYCIDHDNRSVVIYMLGYILQKTGELGESRVEARFTPKCFVNAKTQTNIV